MPLFAKAQFLERHGVILVHGMQEPVWKIVAVMPWLGNFFSYSWQPPPSRMIRS